jgi:hypothetical protein
MKNKISGFALTLLPALVEADSISYENVFIVDSHRIGSVLVRYVKLLSDPCLTVQALHHSSDWKVVSSKSFCSYKEISLMDDIFDSSFDDISFAKDGVHFTLNITLRPLAGEQRRECVVPVEQGVIGSLICGDPTSN